MTVVNAGDEDHALRHMPEADAFFGKVTSQLLTAAPKLLWVQAPTASLEHYLFSELAAHPCVLNLGPGRRVRPFRASHIIVTAPDSRTAPARTRVECGRIDGPTTCEDLAPSSFWRSG
jgi:hypothetical protein